MLFSQAFCGLFARRVLSVQLWEAVKASGTKTCGLNACSVALSVCLLQQRWLVKCKGPLSFPADLARRRRNIAGQACLFFATASAVCVPLSRSWLACCCLCSLGEAPALRLCRRIRAFVASCCLSSLEAAPDVVVAPACIAYCCPLVASRGCAESFAVSASVAFSARAASLL